MSSILGEFQSDVVTTRRDSGQSICPLPLGAHEASSTSDCVGNPPLGEPQMCAWPLDAIFSAEAQRNSRGGSTACWWRSLRSCFFPSRDAAVSAAFWFCIVPKVAWCFRSSSQSAWILEILLYRVSTSSCPGRHADSVVLASRRWHLVSTPFTILRTLKRTLTIDVVVMIFSSCRSSQTPCPSFVPTP
jgi:hypothetical protein